MLEANLNERVAQLEAKLERRLGEHARWLLAAWATLLIPIIGLWMRPASMPATPLASPRQRRPRRATPTTPSASSPPTSCAWPPPGSSGTTSIRTTPPSTPISAPRPGPSCPGWTSAPTWASSSCIAPGGVLLLLVTTWRHTNEMWESVYYKRADERGRV
jgi:hypothetical protein